MIQIRKVTNDEPHNLNRYEYDIVRDGRQLWTTGEGETAIYIKRTLEERDELLAVLRAILDDTITELAQQHGWQPLKAMRYNRRAAIEYMAAKLTAEREKP